MNDVDLVLTKLNASSFRRSFRLKGNDLAYLQQKGIDTILQHAADFIASRLAPAKPFNDGKQTPYKGHPVFVAQHATATCCRSCLQKWHKLPKDKTLTEEEQRYIVSVIGKWLTVHIPKNTVIQQSLL
jgi:Domain of unknown function (DUF4186)